MVYIYEMIEKFIGITKKEEYAHCNISNSRYSLFWTIV